MPYRRAPRAHSCETRSAPRPTPRAPARRGRARDTSVLESCRSRSSRERPHRDEREAGQRHDTRSFSRSRCRRRTESFALHQHEVHLQRGPEHLLRVVDD